jgi:hypothetical protein
VALAALAYKFGVELLKLEREWSGLLGELEGLGEELRNCAGRAGDISPVSQADPISPRLN